MACGASSSNCPQPVDEMQVTRPGPEPRSAHGPFLTSWLLRRFRYGPILIPARIAPRLRGRSNEQPGREEDPVTWNRASRPSSHYRPVTAITASLIFAIA